jgi:hypothetical protein
MARKLDEDNRDIFEKVMDDTPPYVTIPIAAILGGLGGRKLAKLIMGKKAAAAAKVARPHYEKMRAGETTKDIWVPTPGRAPGVQRMRIVTVDEASLALRRKAEPYEIYEGGKALGAGGGFLGGTFFGIAASQTKRRREADRKRHRK